MGGKIKLLEASTIAKIAAGEVVERPASVVKELVENSIDAGADSIEVEVDRAGQDLIRVADNGSGMSTEDAEKAFKSHATSKISRIEDLESMTTLGFRGEALSSIASVSQIDITTKLEGGAPAVYMYLESGEPQKVRPAARDRGTTIEVRNLFYNVPARKKFLKKETTEMTAIMEVFTGFVLSRPEVGFRISQGGRCLLDAPRALDQKGRIARVMGEDVAHSMFPVQYSEGDIAIKGFVSSPGFTRKDRKGQLFFVNGRVVRSRVLNEAFCGGYWSMLERGRFPWGVLFISVPPDSIDVNVHPSKLEIKFNDEKAVRSVISEALSRGFDSMKISSAVPAGVPLPKGDAGSDENVTSVPVSGEDELFSEGLPASQKEFDYGMEDPSSVKVSGAGLVSEDEGTEKQSPLTRHNMFQLGNCYIVRVLPGSIVITDQHAAHERVLYEIFSAALRGLPVESQGLLFPLRLDLSASETVTMKQIIPDLARLGFEVELFGERSFVIRSAPAVIKPGDLGAVVRDAISDLSSGGPVRAGYMEELVKVLSCRGAVKAGRKMDFEEMEELLSRVSKCELPFTCPHGRPTSIEISASELEKRFRRV